MASRHSRQSAAVVASAVNEETEILLQFSAEVYYCTEEDGFIEVEVVRIGDCSGITAVKYLTESGAAKAGVHFSEARGSIIFARTLLHRQRCSFISFRIPQYSPRKGLRAFLF